MGMKQKKTKLLFEKKRFKMADSKKLSFSTTPKSWAITAKISWIVPWVSRIDWCKGHGHEAVWRKLKNRQKIHCVRIGGFEIPNYLQRP